MAAEDRADNRKERGKIAEYPPLAALGRRICILGPSNSGKSTLTHALAQNLDVPSVHLDVLRHIPNTAWEPRPLEEFVAAHDAAITGEGWVIDGNYSVGLPQRLERATGVIWIDPPLWGCIGRYLKRCFQKPDKRFGRLDGATREFSFELIHYTLTQYPKKKPKYAAMIAARPALPFIYLASMKHLNALYAAWELAVPS